MQNFIKNCLEEADIAVDYASFMYGDSKCTAWIMLHEPGMVAGIPFVTELFKELNCQVNWMVQEGSITEKSCTKLAIIHGSIKSILKGEDIAIKILSFASGIATLANKLCECVKSLNWKGYLETSGYTTPGFNFLERYALAIGGIKINNNVILLTANHIFAAGSLSKAVEYAKKVGGPKAQIEVVATNQSTAEDAVKAGVNVVRLDTGSLKEFQELCMTLKYNSPDVKIAFCGAITEEGLIGLAQNNVDVIICSTLFRQANPLSVALIIEPNHNASLPNSPTTTSIRDTGSNYKSDNGVTANQPGHSSGLSRPARDSPSGVEQKRTRLDYIPPDLVSLLSSSQSTIPSSSSVMSFNSGQQIEMQTVKLTKVTTQLQQNMTAAQRVPVVPTSQLHRVMLGGNPVVMPHNLTASSFQRPILVSMRPPHMQHRPQGMPLIQCRRCMGVTSPLAGICFGCKHPL